MKKLRLLKIANSKANLHIINVSFYRGGITEDVDFDIDLVSQATNVEPITGALDAELTLKVALSILESSKSEKTIKI